MVPLKEGGKKKKGGRGKRLRSVITLTFRTHTFKRKEGKEKKPDALTNLSRKEKKKKEEYSRYCLTTAFSYLFFWERKRKKRRKVNRIQVKKKGVKKKKRESSATCVFPLLSFIVNKVCAGGKKRERMTKLNKAS